LSWSIEILITNLYHEKTAQERQVGYLARVFSTSPLEGSMCARDNPARSVDELLLQCVDEVLFELLGGRAREAVYDHLERDQSLARTDIPKHLNKFLELLDETFGKGGKTICKSIIRRMYDKLDWKFYEIRDYEFVDYLDAIRARIARVLIEHAKAGRQDPSILEFPKPGK
jgi:hypothetical protein